VRERWRQMSSLHMLRRQPRLYERRAPVRGRAERGLTRRLVRPLMLSAPRDTFEGTHLRKAFFNSFQSSWQFRRL